VQPFAAGPWSRSIAPFPDYTDVYLNPDEGGRGYFVVQSERFQFIALFVQGPDGKPTWYTAELTIAADGKSYTGPLYSTSASYFGDPWDPKKAATTQVGTASFTPIDSYRANISYSLDGGPSVTTPVQRQTLLPYRMSGSYSGSLAGTTTSCADPADNDNASQARFDLQVTQVNDDSIALHFSLVGQDAGTVCTASGPLTHFGHLYRVAGGQLSCAGDTGGSIPATIEALHPTGQGIEGLLLFNEPSGCVNRLRFSAVRK
jgi:hypothetical protein